MDSRGRFVRGNGLFRHVRIYDVSQCAADQLPRKLKTRAVSLVFPFLCWNTIYFVLSHKLDANLTFRDIVSSVLFYGDNGAAWYLFNLIVFTAFCYPIFYIMKNRFTGLALIAAFAVLQILNVPFPLQLRWDSAFYYLIGAWLDMHSSKIVEIHSKSKSIIGIAGIAVLICGFAVGNALQIPALKSMSLIGCCLATWFVLDLISLPKLPKNISSVSFTIYVSHGLLLRLFSFAVLKLFAVTAYTALILFFAYPILVLIFSVYFVKLVQKSKIATMCLLGGRVKEIA
ncbi:MAG: acyltransferase family protein [Oscillospiraceae bacterium]